MTAQLIDGKNIAAQLRIPLSETISNHCKKGLRRPGLAVILVGNDPASLIYVKNKEIACEEVGIKSFQYRLPDTISEEKLIEIILELNKKKEVDGILLQLPLPKQINTNKVLELISPEKDVDGFHPYNLGRLAQKQPLFRPCTPFGIMMLLDHIGQIFKGKHAVIVGASNIVGRPIALELLNAGATITICHKFTHDLKHYVQDADILISAVGKPGLIQGNWVKKNSTVIDVGINHMPDGSIKGDVEFETAKQYAAWITPVPGGVGPMTVTMLLNNTLSAYLKSSNQG